RLLKCRQTETSMNTNPTRKLSGEPLLPSSSPATRRLKRGEQATGPRLSRAAAATTTGTRHPYLLRDLTSNALRLWRAAVRYTPAFGRNAPRKVAVYEYAAPLELRKRR
ncbi:MAG TPA: hypothetical protein VKM56_11850, partial [Verrucomicrobiae bacterium]|nr:hypothetical protein [Verrucomicrobiae bacterium]